MVQAYREFGSAPDSLRSSFQHLIYNSGAFCPSFNVEFSLTAEPTNDTSTANNASTAASSSASSKGGGVTPPDPPAPSPGGDDYSALYALTNKRVVTVLELLGFDFAHTEDLNSMTESTFEVFVSYDKEGTGKIASGYVANANPPEGKAGENISCRSTPPRPKVGA